MGWGARLSHMIIASSVAARSELKAKLQGRLATGTHTRRSEDWLRVVAKTPISSGGTGASVKIRVGTREERVLLSVLRSSSLL